MHNHITNLVLSAVENKFQDIGDMVVMGKIITGKTLTSDNIKVTNSLKNPL